MIIKKTYTFSDVLLKPQYSENLPTQCETVTNFTQNITLNIPIISSAMDTVTESQMAIAVAQAGGIGVIHKNLSAADQASEVSVVKNQNLIVAAAVGVGEREQQRARALIDAGVDAIVVDTAHGHSQAVGDMIKFLKKEFPKIDIVGGNIASANAVDFLAGCGVHGIKVGIGPGSICTTRVVAGVGIPQLSAILECAQRARDLGIPVIADGGIKLSGDIVKALAAGASSVMLGSLLGACDEAPGEIIEKDGMKWKSYRGMGSLGAMKKGSKDRYGQADVKDAHKLVPEGVEAIIPAKGPVADFLFQMVGGIRAGMGYLGAKNLEHLYQNAEFVEITAAGLAESHAHGVTIVQKNLNYDRS